MRVLITGGAGFIGSWLSESLANEVEKFVIIDNLSPQVHGHADVVNLSWMTAFDNLEFIYADIQDDIVMDDLLQHIDIVVHLAAETGTGQSMYQISHYCKINEQATANLFDRIVNKHKHIKRVILASSRSVYGEGAYRLGHEIIVPKSRHPEMLAKGMFEPLGPNGENLELIATPEDVTPYPSSIYASTKLSNENLGRIVSETYDLTVAVLRFQNVYGERQSLRNPYTGILSIFSNRMRQNLPINIFEDGKESRDFIHVSDVVRALKSCVHSSIPKFSIANIGTGNPTSVLDLANCLKKNLKSISDLIITGDFRAGDIRHCYANIDQAKKLYGFKSEILIQDGIKLFCDSS
jgi:dTDP-L-rhamnose 4-epimerase